jgi:beta-1,4-N-acetylglucosaminyltransferase
MNEKSVLLVYGSGGHREQMVRLHRLLKPEFETRNYRIVGLCEDGHSIDEFDNYTVPVIRNKYSRLKSMLAAPFRLMFNLIIVVKILVQEEIVAIVSTGPGLAVIPAVVFKLAGARIVYVETWSRFETKSVSGILMYKLSDRFFYQNKSLGKFYPSGRYSGLL